jgi:uncharacterized protein (UPF0261 family)
MEAHGAQHQYLADCIRQNGHRAIFMDVGIRGSPQIAPHISRQNVSDLPDLEWRLLQGDPDGARKMMLQAAPRKLLRLWEERKIEGAVCLGFGEAATIGNAALRRLPFGCPKVLLGRPPRPRTDTRSPLEDTLYFPCAQKIETLNRLSRPIFAQAAGAVCGMIEAVKPSAKEDAPLIFASVFGNTATGVQLSSELLEKNGYQVVAFRATGTGGRTMEALITEGAAEGVLDFTLKEIADEVVGGVLSAGPNRLEAAAKQGVPAVVVPGCLDIVNFYAAHTVPPRFAGRLTHLHSPRVTLLRTTPEEAAEIGRRVARKLNASTGPVTVLLPLLGLSSLGSPGYAFHQPKADDALFQSLRKGLRKDIPLIEMDATVSDPAFADACVRALLSNLASRAPRSRETRN